MIPLFFYNSKGALTLHRGEEQSETKPKHTQRHIKHNQKKIDQDTTATNRKHHTPGGSTRPPMDHHEGNSTPQKKTSTTRPTKTTTRTRQTRPSNQPNIGRIPKSTNQTKPTSKINSTSHHHLNQTTANKRIFSTFLYYLCSS